MSISPNRSMPPGVIIPELAYRDVHEAAQWLCRAFGFAERLRIFEHRIQLTYGGASVVVKELPANFNARGAAPMPATHSVMVRVADLDAHHAQAAKNGSRIINPPTEYPFGEKQYTAEDLAGHRWTFSQTLSDVDPTSWGGVVVS